MNSIKGISIDEALDFITRPNTPKEVIVVTVACIQKMRLMANVFCFDSYAERRSYLNDIKNKLSPMMGVCGCYTATEFLEKFL